MNEPKKPGPKRPGTSAKTPPAAKAGGAPFHAATEILERQTAHQERRAAQVRKRGRPSRFWAAQGVALDMFHRDPGKLLPPQAIGMWRARREAIRFLLRSIPIAFRNRHHEITGVYARHALQAAFQALKAYDHSRPDLGASDFDLPFNTFKGEWNAAVAGMALDRPRRAGLARRAIGDETRDEVTAAWTADKGPERGRIGRIAKKLRTPESTVRLALETAGVRKAKKRN